MKWLGQHIYDYVSRFRQDIHVSKVSGDSTLELSSWSTTAGHSGTLKFLKSGTAVLDTYTAGNHTTAGETLGRIEAFGVTDGDTSVMSSYIEFANDAISDADSVPGRIIFATSDADDAGTPTPRLIINDDGQAQFAGAVVIDEVTISTVQGSSESFVDNDTSIMTSAAIADKIEAYGYSTGDITGVTAGTNLSGGGTSGGVTINLADASTSAKGAARFSSDNFAASSGAINIKSGGVDLTDEVTGTLPIANGGNGNTIGSLVILSAGNGYLSTITADEWYFGNNSYGHSYHNWNNVKAAITADEGTFTMSEDYNLVGRLIPEALSKVKLQVSARPAGSGATGEVLSVCIVSADRDGAGTNTTWTVLAQGTITQVQGEYDGVDVTFTGSVATSKMLAVGVGSTESGSIGTTNVRFNYALTGYIA